jgi:hypothetical protein
MPSHEKELDRLFNTPILKPPADFLDRVMSQVENSSSVQFLRKGAEFQHNKVKKQLKVVVLNLIKVAAFVFGILMATAAV